MDISMDRNMENRQMDGQSDTLADMCAVMG